jgi:hypothetical protein
MRVSETGTGLGTSYFANFHGTVPSCNESLNAMKGPGLQFELRALRVFQCNNCGRRISLPGSATSHQCGCADPPRFMTPIDRKPAVSPDVTAFLSPAEPGDLEEDLTPEVEEPYVPHVPQIPVRPPQFPGRRKLSEDIEKYQPAEFGVGISETTSAASSDTQRSATLSETGHSDSGQHDGSRQREGGRGRDRFRDGNRRDRNEGRSPRREQGRPSADAEPREGRRTDLSGNASDRQGTGSPGGASGVRKPRDRRAQSRSPETDSAAREGNRSRHGDAESSVSPIPGLPGTADEFGSGLETMDNVSLPENETEKTEGTSAATSNRRRRRRR